MRMPDFLDRIDVRWILTLLIASLASAAVGFGIGLWLGS